MVIYFLEPQYSNRTSFGNKAEVQVTHGGRCRTLLSYKKKVAYVENEVAEVFSIDSNTTYVHIKEFLKQNGLKATTNKQILKDYGVEKEVEEEIW